MLPSEWRNPLAIPGRAAPHKAESPGCCVRIGPYQSVDRLYANNAPEPLICTADLAARLPVPTRIFREPVCAIGCTATAQLNRTGSLSPLSGNAFRVLRRPAARYQRARRRGRVGAL